MGKVILFPKRSAVAGLSEAIESKLRRWRMSNEKSGESLLQFEAALQELMREAHREAMGEALVAADEPSNAVVLEGRTCRRVLTESQTYMTAAGPVAVRRGLFKDRTRPQERAFAAMDKRLGVIDGFWTPKAGREALWLVTQMVPEKAAQALSRLGGMSPSKSSLDRLPKALSARWEEHRDKLEQVLFESQEIPEGTRVLAVSLDGVYAPIESDDEQDDHVEKRRDKHAAGLSARGPDAFREVGCASIAFYDGSVELLGAVRFGRAPEHKKEGVKAMLAAQLRALLERHEGLVVVFLSDGAWDHWDFFESLAIEGHQALDFFHAAEHLNAALGAAYGEGSVKARRAFAEKRHILLEEERGAATVKRGLVQLARTKAANTHQRRILDRAVRYFTAHEDRMRYPQLRAQGLPIGSGVMEASCKTLVAQRLKLSGQRWSATGAQAILTPRGWDQSERFDEAFALLAATYRQPVAIFTPVERNRASG